MEEDRTEGSQRQRLRPQVGLGALVVDGIGGILGAGVYVLIGPAIGLTGAGVWLAFALATVVALLATLSYAELASTFPGAGAEYDYLGHAFSYRLWPFLVGWLLTLNGIASIGAIALGFGGYASRLWPIDPSTGALALVVVLTGLAFLGLRPDTAVNVVLTAFEVGGLVLVVVLGGLNWGHAATLSWPHGVGGLFAATGLLFFALTGFEDMTKLSEEVVDAPRVVPRSLLLAVGTSGVLYVAFAFGIVQLTSLSTLASSDAPLSVALEGQMGGLAGDLLAVVALFATANTALMILMAHSRLVYAMARSGSLPPVLETVWSRTNTPIVGVLLVGLLSAATLPFGGVELLGRIGSWTALVVYDATSLALLTLRLRRPDLHRPFRVPLNVGPIPIPTVLAVVLTTWLSLQEGIESVMIGLFVAGVGAGIYFWLVHRQLRK